VRILRVLALGCILGSSLLLGARALAAQSGRAGSINFTAGIRPSSGQPEPVRGMTFYLLSRSLSNIRKEVENTDGLLDLDHFIAQLGVSAQLKEWMKTHRRVDLAGSDFIKQLTADDIIDVPEFLSAYKEQNGAALHAIIPEPKGKKDEEQKNPEKYKLHREQYRQALRNYVQQNLDTLQGIDAEFRETNPYPRWIHLQSEQQRHFEQRAMQIAQTRYLVATAMTNLSGRASFDDLAPGEYWISNLDTPALAGDVRLHWDVGVPVSSAKTARIELSNLNALETSEQSTP
jgi:hypothetical protein